MYLGSLMTCLIWQFAEEECHAFENKLITKLLHLESCKLTINFFWQGCREINLRIRVDLEIGNMVQLFILAFSKDWRNLSKARKPVNCRVETLTQTTHIGLLLFLPHHAASDQNNICGSNKPPFHNHFKKFCKYLILA